MLIDSQVDMTDEARKSLDKIVPSLVELLGSDDSSADSGPFMLDVADQNALLMLLQQDPGLRAELLGLLRTMPISEDQLRYAVSELTSKTHLPPDEFRNEVYKLIAQWQRPPAYPEYRCGDWQPRTRGPQSVPVYV